MHASFSRRLRRHDSALPRRVLPARPAGRLDAYRGNAWLISALERAGPAILVFPQGARDDDTDPEYLNWGAGREWETYVAEEVPHYIDAHFRTIRSRMGRAIVGVSAGGYGATILGLHHLGSFAVVESWSGYFHPTDPTGTQPLARGAAANAHTLIGDLRASQKRQPTFFAFYVGRGDNRFRAENIQFDGELTSAGVRHVFEVYRGAHQTASGRRMRRRGCASRSTISRARRRNAGLTAPSAFVQVRVVQRVRDRPRPPAPGRTLATAAVLGLFLAVGVFGAYRYVENYWTYRGFAPPHDAAFVKVAGNGRTLRRREPRARRTSPAGRRLPAARLPAHPSRRYPVAYLLHGFPGRPGAFSRRCAWASSRTSSSRFTVCARLILVMPFGSTGSFTDKEWANGVGKSNAWETFVARDVVRAVDRRYRTIRSGRARALVGLSEGGYAALNIGSTIRASSTCSRAGRATSGPTTSRRSSATARRFSSQQPLTRTATRPGGLHRAGTFIWFYSGTDDRLRRRTPRFAAELSRLQLPHRFFLVRGGHNWALWRGNAARALLALSRRLHAA